jgi:ABC-type multidrug transport system fused ATPase/permease subunit
VTPRLLDPSRRWAAAGLIAIAIGEAVSLAAAAAATSAVAAGLMSGEGDIVHVGAAFFASALVAGFLWLRAVAAENFGMRLVGEVRERLARHAIDTARAGRAPTSLGVMSARMAGDLVAIKDWVSTGISDGFAALAAALAGIVILAAACGQIGLALAIVFAVIAALSLAIALPLMKTRWRRVRQARGRVAAIVGDITLSAAALGYLDSGARMIKRLQRRAEGLRSVSVAQRGSAALAQAPGAIATALAFACAIVMQENGLKGPVGVAGWTLLIFSVGLIGAALSGLGRACDAYAAFLVADHRLQRLDAERVDDAAASAADRADDLATDSDDQLTFELNGAEKRIRPGDVFAIARADPIAALETVRTIALHQSDTRFAGRAIAQLSPRRRARRFPLVSPETGLLRGSVGYNLGLHLRSISPSRMQRAIELAGLSPQVWPPQRHINPFDHSVNVMDQARLRLARALCGAPRVIFIADPALMIAPDFEEMTRRIAEETQCAVVVATLASAMAFPSNMLIAVEAN